MGHLDEGENCTVAGLTALQKRRIRYAGTILELQNDLVLKLLNDGTAVSANGYCSYWNVRVTENCTAFNEKMDQVQQIVGSIYNDATCKECTLRAK